MYDQNDIQKYRAGLLARNPEMLAKVTEIRKRLGILPSNDVAEALFDPYAKDNFQPAAPALSTGAQFPENSGIVKPFQEAGQPRAVPSTVQAPARAARPAPGSAAAATHAPISAPAPRPAPAAPARPAGAGGTPVGDALSAMRGLLGKGQKIIGMVPTSPSVPNAQPLAADSAPAVAEYPMPADIYTKAEKAFMTATGRKPDTREISRLSVMLSSRRGEAPGKILADWIGAPQTNYGVEDALYAVGDKLQNPIGTMDNLANRAAAWTAKQFGPQ